MKNKNMRGLPVSLVACGMLILLGAGVASCGDSNAPADVPADSLVDAFVDVSGGDAGDTAGADAVDLDVTGLLDSAMVLVPVKSIFKMGCCPEFDGVCEQYEDEKPYHPVTLPEYYMDKTEVTHRMYKVCVDAGGCTAPVCEGDPEWLWNPVLDANKPVVCVVWQQAKTFCEWAGRRLPTEAEWEKAARGTSERRYPWGNKEATCVEAVMFGNGDDGCGTGGALPVCSRPAGKSPFSSCDMAGNVWEWTADWYGDTYYVNSPTDDPQGPDTGTKRVMRGGSFTDVPAELRTSNRASLEPDKSDVSIGFRCAKSM
jgi:formylglycine-generating enzyme required for sulfatase activity